MTPPSGPVTPRSDIPTPPAPDPAPDPAPPAGLDLLAGVRVVDFTQALSGPFATLMLADLHILEAQIENSRLSPDSSRALFLAQQKNLLWKHEVTDSAFQRSYRYYGIHNKDLNEIYAAVIDTLNKREGRLNPSKANQTAPDQWGPPPAKTN